MMNVLEKNNRFNNFIQRLFTSIILLILFITIYFLLPPWVFSVCMASIGITIIILEMPPLQATWLTPLYPTVPLITLIYLNQTICYHHLVLCAHLVTIMFDTGAYCIGSLIGKHPIAPYLSPKKTWEGALGGVVTCQATLYLLFLHYSIEYSYFFILIINLLLASAAFFGDLFVSLLKRRVNCKDTGNLLPGHGGLLDRLDSLLFVVIIFYLLRNYLKILS